MWWRLVDPEDFVQVIEANYTKVNMTTIHYECQTYGSTQIGQVDESPLNFGETASHAISTTDTQDDSTSIFADADIKDIRPISETMQLTEDDDDKGDNDAEMVVSSDP